jgi:uracil-DNA glycosylase family 4
MNGKPDSCTGCPYFDRPMVRGEGHPNASLFILGQSPGDTERQTGKPFSGSSGEVLNTALRKAGISRAQNYVSNAVKCFVPAGEKVEPAAVKKCKPLLQKELEILSNCKTILTVGKEAFDTLTGKDIKFVHNRKSAESNPFAWLRGCPLRLADGRIVIGTVHPSFVMRSGFLNAPSFEHDVQRAGEFAEGSRVIPPDNFIEHASDREVIEYVNRIILQREGAVDIETPEASADEDELDAVIQTPISLIGLSAAVGESIGVHPDQFHLLDPLFGDGVPNEVVLWAYNGGFDFLHLGKRWSLNHIKPADAMIAFYLLWSDIMSFDFATAASYYCNFGYYKNWRKLDPMRYNTIGNCRDTYGALQIGQECLKEMRRKKTNMEKLFWSLMPVIKAVEAWRTKGCNYDTQSSMKMLITLSKTLQANETWWQEKIPTIDWGSPKQLITLFTAMGHKIPLKKRPNGTSTPCMDDDTLEGLKKKGVQLAGLVQEMRTLRKASDFVDLADKDGRVRTRAKLHGQAGGRIQLVDKSLQTIPEKLGGTFPRSLVIPDHPDDLILVSDFSQAEFFLYAWYTQDPELLAIHQSGDYCYGFFHEEIWKEDYFQPGKPRQKKFARKDIEPWKLLVTKSYPLGFTYGRRQVESKYKWLLDWYHKKFSRVAPFHSELIFQATRDGYLQTVFGRMRRFPNPRGQHNQILAFPGQSTLPDVLTGNAILPLERTLPRLFGERSRVLFTVHDSVICNIQGAARDVKTATEACEHVDATLSSPIPEMNGFFLRAETKIGPNWNDTFTKERWYEQNCTRTTSTV